METVILTIEVTAELDKALQEAANASLLTKEDIAKGIIAADFVKAKAKTGPFNLSPKAVSVFIAGLTSAIANALAVGKKEEAEEKGAE